MVWNKMTKKHEHKFYPSSIYELQNYTWIIVKLCCDCGKEDWDEGELKEV